MIQLREEAEVAGNCCKSIRDMSTVTRIDFSQDANTDYWQARTDCKTQNVNNRLIIDATGNDPIVGFLPTGKAAEWLTRLDHQAALLCQTQKPDGSFRTSGKYAEGHFEDTASGPCGRAAATLLRHARMTGNAKSLEAGLKTLTFASRFRTPRGAQTWECPLHTPDIMASGYLTMAHSLRMWFRATS